MPLRYLDGPKAAAKRTHQPPYYYYEVGYPVSSSALEAHLHL